LRLLPLLGILRLLPLRVLRLLSLWVPRVRLALALALHVLHVWLSVRRGLRSGAGRTRRAAPLPAVPTRPAPAVSPGSDHPKHQEEQAPQEQQREEREEGEYVPAARPPTPRGRVIRLAAWHRNHRGRRSAGRAG